MFGRMAIFGLFAAALVFSPSISLADSAPSESISDLQLQVAALSRLNELNLSMAQLRSAQSIGNGAADPTYIGPKEGTADPAYHDALVHLRDALATGDEGQISQARKDLDKVQKDAPPDATELVNLSDAARRKAGDFVSLLNTSQYANFIALHAGKIPDAAQVIFDGMDQSRHLSAVEYVHLRDRTADEVASLIVGVQTKPPQRITSKVKNLMDKARKMSDDDYPAERDDLQKNAKSFPFMRQARAESQSHNWIARQMAELLSNPELPEALAARIRFLRN